MTPAESATNGATVSPGRTYPGLAMKTNSQRPASGGVAGNLELAMKFDGRDLLRKSAPWRGEVFPDEQDAVDSFSPDRAARHYDILEWVQKREKRSAPDLPK